MSESTPRTNSPSSGVTLPPESSEEALSSLWSWGHVTAHKTLLWSQGQLCSGRLPTPTRPRGANASSWLHASQAHHTSCLSLTSSICRRVRTLWISLHVTGAISLPPMCAQQRLVVARPTPEVRIVPPADTDPLEAGGGGQGHTEVRNAIQGALPSPQASYRARLGSGSSAHCPLSGKRWDTSEFTVPSSHLPPIHLKEGPPTPPRLPLP